MIDSTFPTPIRFYLGANTPRGFTGFPEDLYALDGGWRAYLIKGAPGTGKSTLMRRFLTAALEKGYEPEAICCSSDPDSLDGVVLREKKIAVLDATAPHAIEPQLWGAVERIVDLSCCLDGEKLRQKCKELLDVRQKYRRKADVVRRYITGAGTLLEDNRAIADQVVNADKIDAAAVKIADKEFPETAACGRQWRRFLSAVTPQGYITFYSAAQALCPKLYVIEDEDSAVAGRLLEALRIRALSAGHEVFACLSPIRPDNVDHLLIPALGVGFLHADSRQPVDFPVYRHIRAERFLDSGYLRTRRQRFRLHRQTAEALLDDAVTAAKEAKQLHDRWEKLNAEAMDWRAADETAEKWLCEWFSYPDC